jgi:hypothetical protein
MTAIATPYVRAPRPVVHRIPLLRLIRVELRKMFNTRSGFWLLASIVIATVLATLAVIVFAPGDELTYSTFIEAIRLPIAVILPIIAILSVTSEWSQRTGLTTFTLVPHRRRIIAAKAISSVTVGVLAVLLALVIGALGNLAGAAVTGTALVWDASPLECLYFVVGSILSLMIGFMLGVLIRASIGAIVALCPWCLLVTVSTTLVFATLTHVNIRDDNLYLPAPAQQAATRFIDADLDVIVVTIWLLVLGLVIVTRYGPALFG